MSARPGHVAPLTLREREILALLAEGLTRVEIGRRLYVSPETVKSHARHTYWKLGARNGHQAVAIAVRRGIIA